MYYMRHTRDYETLELPVGASRADVKAAYRKLAKVRHQAAHPHVKGPSGRGHTLCNLSPNHLLQPHRRADILASNILSFSQFHMPASPSVG